MKHTKEFLSKFSKEDLKRLMDSVNAYHCTMKETAKDRVSEGKITEARYRELRTIEALLSYVEADLEDLTK